MNNKTKLMVAAASVSLPLLIASPVLAEGFGRAGQGSGEGQGNRAGMHMRGERPEMGMGSERFAAMGEGGEFKGRGRGLCAEDTAEGSEGECVGFRKEGFRGRGPEGERPGRFEASELTDEQAAAIEEIRDQMTEIRSEMRAVVDQFQAEMHEAMTDAGSREERQEIRQTYFEKYGVDDYRDQLHELSKQIRDIVHPAAE